MRRVLLVVSMSAVAACEIPEKRLQGPFDCLNQPLPTTADSPVTLSGDIEDAFQPATLGGASVRAFIADVPTALDTETSAPGTGAFTLTIPTGNKPQNAFARASISGYLMTTLFPPSAMAQSVAGQRVEVLRQQDVDALAGAFGLMQTQGLGFLLVVAEDCNGSPLGGVSISTTANVPVHYFDDNIRPAPDATSTDNTTGTAVIFNVPLGGTTIMATSASPPATLRPVGINVPDGVTQVGIAP